MSDVDNITTVAREILKAIAQDYEQNEGLPNLCRTDDMQSLMISLHAVADNLTLAIVVVKQGEREYYLDLTAYFANQDYVYPEGSPKESAIYSLRGSPRERVFNEVYELSAESLTEAFIDAFYVILDELHDIVSLISGVPIEK